MDRREWMIVTSFLTLVMFYCRSVRVLEDFCEDVFDMYGNIAKRKS